MLHTVFSGVFVCVHHSPTLWICERLFLSALSWWMRGWCFIIFQFVSYCWWVHKFGRVSGWLQQAQTLSESGHPRQAQAFCKPSLASLLVLSPDTNGCPETPLQLCSEFELLIDKPLLVDAGMEVMERMPGMWISIHTGGQGGDIMDCLESLYVLGLQPSVSAFGSLWTASPQLSGCSLTVFSKGQTVVIFASDNNEGILLPTTKLFK